MYTFNFPAFKSISDLLQEVSGFPVILIFQILYVISETSGCKNQRYLAGECYPQIFFHIYAFIFLWLRLTFVSKNVAMENFKPNINDIFIFWVYIWGCFRIWFRFSLCYGAVFHKHILSLPSVGLEVVLCWTEEVRKKGRFLVKAFHRIWACTLNVGKELLLLLVTV